MAGSMCWLCGLPGELTCSECEGVTACSSHHLQPHTNPCKPVRVEFRENTGNGLVATKDIKAGATIFRDSPAVVAPSLVSAPVCLDCLSTWKGECVCSECGFPVCDPTCQAGKNHQQECGVLSQLSSRPQFEAGQKNHPALCLVGVVRLLRLANTQPQLANRVNLLMDHVEDIQASPDLYNMWNGTAVQSLVRELPGSPYTEQDILRAVGVLHTNSVAGLGRGHALYPTFSLVNHSCLCNARFQIHPDRSILLRAQVDIKAGEEITIQYLTPLIGTWERRQKMVKNWFFACTCPRCADPTELGTNFSGIVCRECKETILPLNSLDQESMWACSNCGIKITSKTVQALVARLQADAASLDPLDLDSMQDMLVAWRQVLHPHHYIFLQLKRSILGCIKALTEKYAPRHLLVQRIELAEENIRIFDILDPGLTMLRGRMIQHANAPKLQIAKMDLQEGRMTKPDFLQFVAAAMKNVKLASKCFEDYGLPLEA